MHVRFVHFCVQQPRGRIHRDGARVGGFSDNLPMDLGFCGDIDNHVPKYLRLAPQSASLFQATNSIITLFNRIPFGQCGFNGNNIVLGK